MAQSNLSWAMVLLNNVRWAGGQIELYTGEFGDAYMEKSGQNPRLASNVKDRHPVAFPPFLLTLVLPAIPCLKALDIKGYAHRH